MCLSANAACHFFPCVVLNCYRSAQTIERYDTQEKKWQAALADKHMYKAMSLILAYCSKCTPAYSRAKKGAAQMGVKVKGKAAVAPGVGPGTRTTHAPCRKPRGGSLATPLGFCLCLCHDFVILHNQPHPAQVVGGAPSPVPGLPLGVGQRALERQVRRRRVPKIRDPKTEIRNLRVKGSEVLETVVVVSLLFTN